MKNRSGVYLPQPTGYRAFMPKPLPPRPPLKIDREMAHLLSTADRSLARLDGITMVLPNPDLFIGMYVKKEALLSSQIEGTEASLEGVLEFEADLTPKGDVNQVKEVINYIEAMNYGLDRLKTLPMSLRLIKEIHRLLMKGVRGRDKTPGEFKRTQNWIGPKGATLLEATFVPPPPHEATIAMGSLEKYIHRNDILPPLIKIALIHAQFETIHPFLDGNGRIGRLLITFYLCWKKILNKPLLYLSIYLKKNQVIYYDLLMKVRNEGAWEEWVKFFLTGVAETSQEAAGTAREIIRLKEDMVTLLHEKCVTSVYAIKLLDRLFHTPLIGTSMAARDLKTSRETANQLIKKFIAAGILKETTGKQRHKRYVFKPYVSIIARGTEQ